MGGLDFGYIDIQKLNMSNIREEFDKLNKKWSRLPNNLLIESLGKGRESSFEAIKKEIIKRNYIIEGEPTMYYYPRENVTIINVRDISKSMNKNVSKGAYT